MALLLTLALWCTLVAIRVDVLDDIITVVVDIVMIWCNIILIVVVNNIDVFVVADDHIGAVVVVVFHRGCTHVIVNGATIVVVLIQHTDSFLSLMSVNSAVNVVAIIVTIIIISAAVGSSGRVCINSEHW